MKIQLSDHFTYGRLFRFTLPSIVMMVFTSIYSVVDGLFVSNIVGSNALSAINIVMPLMCILGAFGFMLGTGGSAEVAKTLGQGDNERANRYFTMLIFTIVAVGAVLSVACIAFIRPLVKLLGASELLMEDCVTYGTICMIGMVAFMLQTTFQSFFVVAGKPNIGLALTVASGVTNMVLDFVFVYLLKWGVGGAAAATVCGYIVGGIVPFIYFARPNGSTLRLGKLGFYPSVLLHSCTNGSSEMLSNISASLITFLYNRQLMSLVGEDGVAAITVIMYVNFIFVAILIGFAIGTAPVIGFNYGAQNNGELKNMYAKSMRIVAVVSIAMTLLAELLAEPVVAMFVGRGNVLADMTLRGFRLYSLSFLICGLNIYGSSFFTALCNGKISAIISFARSLVFQAATILIMPMLFGLDGVWLAIVVAETLTAAITIYFMLSQRRHYHYA